MLYMQYYCYSNNIQIKVLMVNDYYILLLRLYSSMILKTNNIY